VGDGVSTTTVRDLFAALQAHLGLAWAAGADGGGRVVRTPGDDAGSSASLVDRLNLIEPASVAVLGSRELHFLESLRSGSRADALERLLGSGVTALIVADARAVPEELRASAEAAGTPVLTSPRPAAEVVSGVRRHLAHLFSEQVILHGVFMEVMGIGVLITGDSSVGKSELALELVSRGHRLIADDAPEFSRIDADTLNGTCPEILRDFLEVRGLGLLNVRAMYGDGAIRRSKYLRLLVHLQPAGNRRLREMDRISPYRRMRRILGVEVPEITLPVATGRNLAVLVEAAVRSHVLYMNGYDAGRDFEERQRLLLERQTP